MHAVIFLPSLKRIIFRNIVEYDVGVVLLQLSYVQELRKTNFFIVVARPFIVALNPAKHKKKSLNMFFHKQTNDSSLSAAID